MNNVVQVNNVVQDAISGLKLAERAAAESGKNASAPAGATLTEVGFYNKGLRGNSVITRRVEDVFLFQATIKASGDHGFSRANFDYNTSLNNLLGEANNPLSISNTLTSFLNSFDSASSNALDKKANILSSARTFTSQVTSYVAGLKNIKSTLETDITNSVNAINDKIKQIVSVNRDLGSPYSGDTSMRLKDQRDTLLGELGEYLAIQYSFNSNGMVDVRSANGNCLVNRNEYAQMSYTQDLDLLSHNTSSDIIKTYYYKANGRSIT
jgi:flagellar hook-associated protein FlgK